MPNNVIEVFTPKRMSSTGVVCSPGSTLGGFFCTTSGTVRIRSGTDVSAPILLDTFDAVAGVFYPMPFSVPAGAYAELGGGAVGTFGYL